MVILLSKKMLFVFICILAFILASGVYAKSENSNSGQGNSDDPGQGSSNSGKGSQNVILGTVDEVSNNQITVEEKKGKGKIETEVDKKTKIIHQNGQGSSSNKGKGSINSIKKEDKIAIISDDEDSTESGKPKKAVKVFVKEASAAAQSKRRAVQGVITEVNGLTLTIAHQIHRERISTVSANAATKVKIKGTDDANFSSLQVGQRVAVVGDLIDGGGILAKRIHVIPGKATGIFRRFPIATSSATPSASASASPEASATLEPSP